MVDSLSDSLIDSLIDSLSVSLFDSLSGSLVDSLVDSFVDSWIDSWIESLSLRSEKKHCFPRVFWPLTLKNTSFLEYFCFRLVFLSPGANNTIFLE